jgi:putative RNA 2'-phosphotransferase
MNYVKLSKEISYALRHAPWEYELELDENGWVDIKQLLDSLKLDKNWTDLTVTDIEEMIKQSDKKRHEISNGKIRALYGHSTPERIKLEEKEPPEILFHGTAKRFIDNIKKNGLLPMSRQYVHLSVDIETAKIVGKRRDSEPVILKIYSGKAFEDGIKFYHGNDNIWLADKIDSKYIES